METNYRAKVHQDGFKLYINDRLVGNFNFSSGVFPNKIEEFSAIPEKYTDYGFDHGWDERALCKEDGPSMIKINGDAGALSGSAIDQCTGTHRTWTLTLPRETILDILRQGQEIWWPFVDKDDFMPEEETKCGFDLEEISQAVNTV